MLFSLLLLGLKRLELCFNLLSFLVCLVYLTINSDGFFFCVLDVSTAVLIRSFKIDLIEDKLQLHDLLSHLLMAHFAAGLHHVL